LNIKSAGTNLAPVVDMSEKLTTPKLNELQDSMVGARGTKPQSPQRR